MRKATVETGDKPINFNMLRFNAALGAVLKVSKADLNRILAEEKAHPAPRQKRGRKPKTSASSPSSSCKD